jgi:prepilin-type N-terminal cleavage/methylation domain-containing protein
MKIPVSSRRHGFTLIELLVVITIIAVLAGAGFAVGNSAIQKAKKTTALNTAIAVESAVNNFFTEYGSMPTTATDDTPSQGISTGDSDGKDLLKVLLGIESTSPPMNTRAVKFLNVKEGKKKGATGTNGLIYDTSGSDIVGLYDPWGGGYKVVMDGNYDEKIKVKPKASSSEKTLNGKRVACWSDGADGVSTTGKASDDVYTWNP